MPDAPRDAWAAESERTAALHRAVWAGDVAAVAALLDGGASVNSRDRRGFSLLARAVEQGHAGLARLLLDRGADPNARDRRGRTPLYWAARLRSAEPARALLARGADPLREPVRSSSFVQAFSHGRREIAQAIFESHAWGQAAYEDQIGRLRGAVDAAVEAHRAGALLALLELPAGPFGAAVQEHSDRRLHLSVLLVAAARRGNTGAVRVLAARVADVNRRLPPGITALTEALRGGHTETAATLRGFGATYTVADAIRAQDAGYVAAAFSAGTARPDDADQRGVTLLMRAVQEGEPDIVALLLHHGATVDAADRGGATALFRAAEAGSVPLMELLLTHGADPFREADGHRTALSDAALRAPNPAALALLLERGRTADRHWSRPALDFALACAAFRNDPEFARLLLEAGAEPDGATYGETPALIGAATAGNRPVVRLLAAAGADLHRTDRDGHTALELAAGGGRWRTTLLLLELGADPPRHHPRSPSPLHRAVAAGRADVVQRLIEAGADPNARDPAGRTPLDIALRNERLDIVVTLAAAGAV
jgi:ankyrin repeat protein